MMIMSNKNTGGPAFPCEYEGSTRSDAYGMTLRDYFAAKAMQAMITTSNGPCLNGLEGYESHTASAAYRISDAMLEARND